MFAHISKLVIARFVPKDLVSDPMLEMPLESLDSGIL
jgi:hypothetical protein